MAAKYSDHFVPPGEYVDELVLFSPEVQLGYNSAGEIIRIKKLTSDGGVYVREIVDPDISDYTVTRWVVHTRYRKVRGG